MPKMSSSQVYKETSYSSSFEWPTIPERDSSCRYQPNQSRTSFEQMSIKELFCDLGDSESETCSRFEEYINTKLNIQIDNSSKARAPWAQPEDFIPGKRKFTPQIKPRPNLGRFERHGLFGVDEVAFHQPPLKTRLPSPLASNPLMNHFEYTQSQLNLSFERLQQIPNLSLMSLDWDASSLESIRSPQEAVTEEKTPPEATKSLTRNPKMGLARILSGLKKLFLKKLKKSA
ncbi:hypothetical protein RRF57_000894 [Xylaria bambusicola]|uniref:Uncharacterized protein n=1 Tax=Xylaria bambusicola TaxID=326684 RepID=A0AAN7Z2Z7_9PEZI